LDTYYFYQEHLPEELSNIASGSVQEDDEEEDEDEDEEEEEDEDENDGAKSANTILLYNIVLMCR